jgi:hypothetical protein
MCDIYENAYVTICATSSPDCTAGTELQNFMGLRLQGIVIHILLSGICHIFTHS